VHDIVIYLNGERGLVTLEAVLAAGHGVTAVVVPERLAGSEVARRAAKTGAAVEPVAKVNDPAFVESLKARKARLGLIGGYSTIFKKPLIEAPELGTINLHGGRLPEYRGGSPLNWQIINGETVAGVSVIRVDEGIDSGPVLAEATFPIGPDDTIADAHEKANGLFLGLVLTVLKGFDDGTLVERRQDETHARYWRQRKPADGWINWHDMPAGKVRDLVRGITRPYPGAFTDWQGQRVRVFAARFVDDAPAGAPGCVVGHASAQPMVACRDGALAFTDYEVAEVAGAPLPKDAQLGGGGR